MRRAHGRINKRPFASLANLWAWLARAVDGAALARKASGHGDAGGRDDCAARPTQWVGRQMWIRGLLMLALVVPPTAGVLAGAADASTPPVHSTALLSPRPPAAATTFVWSIGRVATRPAQPALSVQLSGCWSAGQVARATLSRAARSRSPRVRIVGRGGVVTVDHLRSTDLPLTLSVTFRTRFASAPAGAHVVVDQSGRGHIRSTLTVGGPVCRIIPHLHRAIKTVFLIMMENQSWSGIKGSPSAPYINHTLLPLASHAEQYYTPPGNHPSLPNYLWLEAGTNFGINGDDDPSANHQGTTHHLVTLLRAAGISWKTYQESISGTDCPLTSSDPYAAKHNPFVYFDDITGANNPRSAYCIDHVRPYPELANDLRRNTVARYNFITPNLCDDMHDTCSPLNDSIKQGDSWLAQQVPQILNSQAYKRGGALFIVWDEGSDNSDSGNGSDGPIGLLVLSPVAKGHGYANTIHYTHSSTLRTLEEIFGVRPLLGNAAHATDLRDLFTTFP